MPCDTPKSCFSLKKIRVLSGQQSFDISRSFFTISLKYLNKIAYTLFNMICSKEILHFISIPRNDDDFDMIWACKQVIFLSRSLAISQRSSQTNQIVDCLKLLINLFLNRPSKDKILSEAFFFKKEILSTQSEIDRKELKNRLILEANCFSLNEQNDE